MTQPDSAPYKSRHPMTLARAKRVLKQYVAGELNADFVHEVNGAIEKIVSSWEPKAKTGKGRRAKGHDFERLIANVFRPLYPTAKRGIQSRGGGAEVPDVDGTPFYLECKRHKTVTGALKLHYRNCEESDERPAVTVVKEDGREPVAMMSLALFVGLADQCDDDRMHLVESKGCEIVEATR